MKPSTRTETKQLVDEEADEPSHTKEVRHQQAEQTNHQQTNGEGMIHDMRVAGLGYHGTKPPGKQQSIEQTHPSTVPPVHPSSLPFH